MLSRLIELRSNDEFELYVTRDSTDEPLLHGFLRSLAPDNWRLVPLASERRNAGIRCMLGLRDYFPIQRDVSILLSSDFDFHNFQGGPQVAHLHDLSALHAPKEYCSLPWHGRRMRRMQLRLLADSTSHVCAVSHYTLSHLLSADSRFQSRCRVIYNGIDDAWHRQPARTSGELPTETPYWIWWGQITRRKNIDGLLHSYAALVQDTGPEQLGQVPKLVLIGSVGADSQTLFGLIEHLDLSDRVILRPFQDLETLIAWVDGSAGVLFPSHFEGFGLPAAEGLSRGKPVLTSDRTSLPEITGGYATLVEPHSVSSIASGLRQMLSNHKADGAVARRQWASEFTYDRAASAYSALIDELTSRCEPLPRQPATVHGC